MRWPVVRSWLFCAAFATAQLTVGPSVAQQGEEGGAAGASAFPSADISEPDPRTPRVRALTAGTLAVDVSPQSLFDVSLEDEAALQIEATRVRALLRAIDEAARAADQGVGKKRSPVETQKPRGLRDEIAALDPTTWNKRLELDRARLEFYELTPERRKELLSQHRARQEAAQPQVTEEERRAREAEAERERALVAAKAARSEAERAVAEEQARLIALQTRIRGLHDQFQHARDDIAVRRDSVLGWQRRVRDAKSSGSADSDAIYDALRRTLRVSRDDLSAALAGLNDDASAVPALGANPLVDVPPDIPTEAAAERRKAVERDILEARGQERALREQKASALLDEITAHNRERLGLLPNLSPAKRSAVTGFTTSGWDQARAELRHLSLILRYHQRAASSWVQTIKQAGGAAFPPWRTAALLLPIALAVTAFLWGRRKSHALLRWGELRLALADRAERRTTPSLGLRSVRILVKIQRPLEWLLFFMVVLWLLPSGARGLLEVQLISSVVGWSLAGSLIVSLVDALASGRTTVLNLENGEPGKLRLRSLRLVERTIIVFALIIVLSVRLVGRGTIYSWVSSTCWFAALPLFLLLVAWWRGIVFERLDRLRKKTSLEQWILANRVGWKSFAPAMIGAVLLFVTGVLRVVRVWLSGFDLARRVHAYLFKREIERLGEGQTRAELTPLAGDAFEKLHPERPYTHWQSCPADEVLAALTSRAAERRGGLVAVVAPRGMGKSTLLRAVAEGAPHSQLVECHAQLRDSELHSSIDAAASIVLLDDAHTLVEARIGGFAKFDSVVAFARDHSDATTWVFTVDASVWPLLKRARDARPIFDEIHILSAWDEKQLGALLAARSEGADIAPQFDTLLDRLPSGTTELDRQDALQAKRSGYERMLWDHVGGSPGLALEAWRVSLARDPAGAVHVRPLQVPDVTALEDLSESSLFVLRAVLQLAPVTVETVSLATRLRDAEVLQDVRFGEARGFYENQAGHVRITWAWLRAVRRLLERRHLLVNV